MRLVFLCVVSLAVTACSVTNNTPGQLSGVDASGRLTITGPKQFGGDPKPSDRMVEQAKAVCPEAEFLYAEPSTVDFNLYEYEFRC